MNSYAILNVATGQSVATIKSPEPLDIKVWDGYKCCELDTTAEVPEVYFKSDLTNKMAEEVFRDSNTAKITNGKIVVPSSDFILPVKNRWELVLYHQDDSFSGYKAGIPEGNYVALTLNDETVMSNTPFEKYTNRHFIENAHGKVLIAGLGIGLLTEELKLLPKGRISQVDVVEINESLLDFYNVINYDVKSGIDNIYISGIHEFVPKEKYDTIYFDIWNILSDETIDEGRCLVEDFTKYLNPDGFISFWGADIGNLYNFFHHPEIWRNFK